MNRYQPKGPLERGAAADLWRNTLSQIPSIFGRLVYLRSLRDDNTGRYVHYGVSERFGDREADRILRESHQQTFSEWLCYNLEQQKADLDLYLSALEGDRRVILEAWIRLTPYRNLVPSMVREVERQLFLADLETILELLNNEHGVSAPDSDA